MNLIFATNNLHKLDEIRVLTHNRIRILGLSEAGFQGEIPEEYPTLEQNASQKAWYIYNRLNQNCFADDTGLEVESLDGAPGVYSARFSRIGELQYPELDVTEGNIKKLLAMLEGKTNRRARFRTVISIIVEGQETQFEGVVNGTIASVESGTRGFGYDPVFVPDGETRTFAEMNIGKKNKISHRGVATNKLVDFLNL